MKNFLTEYNLELLSALMFAFVTIASAVNPNPSVFQRALLLYAFLFTLHEWEEIRYLGGFANLMEGMITAYMLLLTSVILLSLYSANNMLEFKDCVLGLLCLIACFALMQNRVLAINGIKYREMLNIIKNK